MCLVPNLFPKKQMAFFYLQRLFFTLDAANMASASGQYWPRKERDSHERLKGQKTQRRRHCQLHVEFVRAPPVDFAIIQNPGYFFVLFFSFVFFKMAPGGAALLLSLVLSASANGRPNFLILFGDDWGYGDLGANWNGPYTRTSHLMYCLLRYAQCSQHLAFTYGHVVNGLFFFPFQVPARILTSLTSLQ